MKKTFIFLLIALLMGSITIQAKKTKHGSQLTIKKTNGRVIKGELLKVNKDSLLIMESSTSKGISVLVSEIQDLTIHRKAKILKRTGVGVLAGAVLAGALVLIVPPDKEEVNRSTFIPAFIAGTGAALGTCAALIGFSKNTDITIPIQGRSSDILPQVMKKLCKRARYKTESQQEWKNVTKTSETNGDRVDSYMGPRYHAHFQVGGYNSEFERKFEHHIHDGITWPSGLNYFREYPVYSPRSQFPISGLRIEYDVTRNLSLGVAWFHLGRQEANQHVRFKDNLEKVYTSSFLFKGTGDTFCTIASFQLIRPRPLLQNISLKIGGGIGLSRISLEAIPEKYYFGLPELEPEFPQQTFSKTGLCMLAFGELNYHLIKNFSVGLYVEYRYIPARFPAFPLSASYIRIDATNGGPYAGLTQVEIASSKVNYGGLGVGISIGVHF